MTITDGYTRLLTFVTDGVGRHVFYRPATKAEREEFRHFTASLNEAEAVLAVSKFAWDHTVFSEHPSSPGSPEFETLWMAINGLIPDASGETWVEMESVHARNLTEGVGLEKTNPRLAKRSCEECKVYWFNERTGLPIVVTSTGEKMLRDGPTPCECEVGCAKGTPENQKTLSHMNRLAYKHYCECKASSFPNDPIVRKNAVLIDRALSKLEKK